MKAHAEAIGTIGALMAIFIPTLEQLGAFIQVVGGTLGIVLTCLGIYYMRLKIKKINGE